MTLADDLNAPPLARRVADIIRKHAAELELGADWADAAAVRVLAEVTRRPGKRAVSDLPPLYTDGCRCLGLTHYASCREWVLPL